MHGSATHQATSYKEGRSAATSSSQSDESFELAEKVIQELRITGSLDKISGSGLLERVHGRGTRVYVERVRLAKRLMDALLSFMALMFAAPLMVLIAIAIRIDSPGPAIYTQRRLGLRGSFFQALKFRTMCTDADERLKKLLDSDPIVRAEFETYHKIKEDPRVTRLGKFLRKHSLDELPQLINVFKGEMALVGPRAYMPFEIAKIDRPRLNELLKVTPGLTGFWQVAGRSTVSFDERVDMDMFYIHNWSPGMDFYILINTVWMMLFSRGFGSS